MKLGRLSSDGVGRNELSSNIHHLKLESPHKRMVTVMIGAQEQEVDEKVVKEKRRTVEVEVGASRWICLASPTSPPTMTASSTTATMATASFRPSRTKFRRPDQAYPAKSVAQTQLILKP